ncbi:hypothetical protein ABVK25_006920 [Lepraria finkii]|uniref:Mitochondrial ribosomal protein S11 n=1 Tax=Lepraria finkii TaxID=1340010 RepID=A0ABR4B537_9LECA
MSRPLSQLPSLGSICLSCRLKFSRPLARQPSRLISKRLLTTPPLTSALGGLPTTKPFQPKTPAYIDPYTRTSNQQNPRSTSLTYREPPKPHRLHIYATKHNCHITLAQGNRDALISVSSGNLGFRKAARGSYDAAYQLGAFMMSKITSQGMLSDEYPGKGGPIRALEVVLRDFGPGREAVTKILLGSEGKGLRSRILRVMDSTRLKFGGTRSKKPRRLG